MRKQSIPGLPSSRGWPGVEAVPTHAYVLARTVPIFIESAFLSVHLLYKTRECSTGLDSGLGSGIFSIGLLSSVHVHKVNLFEEIK